MNPKIVGLSALVLGFPLSASAQEERENEINKTLSVKIGDYESSRKIHDSDGDGWCDLWCAVHKDLEHRNKKIDTDGDGVTDYEEMILWRDPNVKGPLPRHLTAAEKAAGKKAAAAAKVKAEQEMKALRDQLEPFMVQADPQPVNKAERKAARLLKKQTKLAALKKQAELDKAAGEALIRRMGMPKRGQLLSGETYLLESDGKQIFQKQSHNALSADSISTDEVLPFNAPLANAGLGGTGSSGFDLTGAGLTLGIWDEQDVFGNHSFLLGRVTDRDGLHPNGVHFHATHVAGTLVSNGNGALTGRGMSIASDLDAYDFDDDLIEMPDAASNGLRLSNHSYGVSQGWNGQINFAGAVRWIWWGDPNIDEDEDYNFGFYSSRARDVDAITYDAENYLPVWSAGNDRSSNDSPPANGHIGHVYVQNGMGFISNRDRPNDEVANGGYDMITHYSVAKNTLTVAATEDVVGGYNGTGSVAMSAFSSWGPVDDGRIKPDISANGVNLTSSAINGGLLTISGTSMSAPSVTGSINLLREQYENRIGDADDVLASTYKALVVHTADEAGTTTGPDYRFGWGMMNTLTAANLIDAHGDENSLPHIKEVTLPSGDFVEFTVVAVGGEPLKVTTCWTDPEGTIPPAALDANVAALVNDLDLRLESNGTTYFPWKLDPANFAAAATRNSDNDRDNVEQILIDAPVAGQEYVIRINHKGDLVDDDGNVDSQKLSIVISGNVVEEAPVLQVGELMQTTPTEFTAIFETVVGGEYDVETSPDLTNGSWTTAMTGVLPTKDVSALPLPTSGETRKFWRVIRKK